jgi:hypothetical protein
MPVPKPVLPHAYSFTRVNVEHLEALIKLLERSRNGMPPAEVALMLQSMRRLHAEVTRTASSVEPAPF